MHFLHRQHNTIAQTPALVFFLKASILKGPHPSRPASVHCMHRKFPSEFTLAVNPRFQHYHLTCERTFYMAIQTQTVIGWLPALQGWNTLLAALSLLNHDKAQVRKGSTH